MSVRRNLFFSKVIPSPGMSHVVPLHLLSSGETGSILDVSGSESFVARLEEMGLRTGAEVRMLQPGQPCIIALDNHRLSFRGEDEGLVMVEVDR